MRPISAEIEALLSNGTLITASLLEIRGGATTYRWCNVPYPVTYDGNTFTTMPFVHGEVVTAEGGAQACEVTLFDVDRTVRAALFQEEWSMRPTTLYLAFVVPKVAAAGFARSVYDAMILIDGRADAGSIDLSDENEPLTIPILPETEREGSRAPAQEYETSCRYVNRFKGLQCGYAGAETTCDGTRARCVVLGNEARYGGFPYAPSPGSRIQLGYGAAKTLTTREG